MESHDLIEIRAYLRQFPLTEEDIDSIMKFLADKLRVLYGI